MKNKIKILGAYGAKSSETSMTCLQVDDDILIDAGNILQSLDKSAQYINHIFLTHSHLDHLIDIPFLMDLFYSNREIPLTIYGTHNTLEYLQKHILNWDIWPDFSSIELHNGKELSIIFKPIELNEEIHIRDITFKAIPNNHTDSSCAYVVTKNNNAILITSDTYLCSSIWNEVNNNKQIKSVITDVSFPSAYKELAEQSKHLTPELLHQELQQLTRDDVTIFVNHLKPSFIDEIYNEIETKYPVLLNNGLILQDRDIIDISTLEVTHHISKHQRDQKNISKLLEIGQSLTSEKDFDRLMEKILLSAKELSNADGGTLYLLSEDERSLEFAVVQTDSLNIKMGGTAGKITWPNVQLYKEDGTQNQEQVAALCGLTSELINIQDVYEAEGFNFEGTKKFDQTTGYRTQSMLVVPMVDHENNLIGVLQLLNKQDEIGRVIEFANEDESFISSMASQAAVSITNKRLLEDLEALLMDFIKSIADAISEKSKYTGGHINRVAQITQMIANAINEDHQGLFKDVSFSEDELQQISIAAWMHDIGKITTPEYVVNKATKLETIYDRIETVITRFEILKRDAKIDYLEKVAIAKTDDEKNILEEEYNNKIKDIENNILFLQRVNLGSEFMPEEDYERIVELSKIDLTINNKKTKLLTQNEYENLAIRKGTLTEEEREIINNHVVVSYKMLNKLTFPKKLKRVPIIAGSHHKTIYTKENGEHGGYGAKEIMKEPMSIEDRILAVSDVFEALTANDRPYKKPNSLNQALRILGFMVKDNELDKNIVKFFIENKIYELYAKENLNPEQIDEVNVTI